MSMRVSEGNRDSRNDNSIKSSPNRGWFLEASGILETGANDLEPGEGDRADEIFIFQEFAKLAERVLDLRDDKTLATLVSLTARWVEHYGETRRHTDVPERSLSPTFDDTPNMDACMVENESAHGVVSLGLHAPTEDTQDEQAKKTQAPLNIYVPKHNLGASAQDLDTTQPFDRVVASSTSRRTLDQQGKDTRTVKGKEIVLYNQFNVLHGMEANVECSISPNTRSPFSGSYD
ncbi:hypothetical protein Salat_1751600 [Sesamum alatum]|uniref:Uncharacterized protein n=1 Tax=Sesamum alatum TaxID=300844 RepID=A0AAE1Y8D6_9LAMI|nr:hypothetical protein Salat_1751600 [Sesamum alatum]